MADPEHTDEGGPAGRPPRRADPHDPRRARMRALKILFDADVRREAPSKALARISHDRMALMALDDLDEEASEEPAERLEAARRRSGAAPIDGFTTALVDGVGARLRELDAIIGRHARNWAVPRMPVVDRNILRLATYEMLHEDTRPAIVIDEAVEMARLLSTDESPRFVNGVLDAIRQKELTAGSA